MAKIRLKQKNGEYLWQGRLFQAGKDYEVEDIVAHYLVTQAKVAEAVNPQDKSIPEILQPKSDRIRIALVRIGGIGDSLQLTAIAKAVKRKYPCSEVTLYIRDKAGFDIVNDNPAVDRTIMVGNAVWVDYMDKILEKDYDIVFDNRYITRVYFKDKIKFKDHKGICDERFKGLEHLYNTFPLSCNEIAKKFPEMSNLELSLHTAGLQGDDNDMTISLYSDDFKMLPLIDTERFVTIHNGADIARQTKQWNHDYWEQVVDHLRVMGYKVIQLGTKFESVIEGAIDMTGRTSLKECAALISKAKFHIDSEGGLVHIARAVKTRSIVVFGPTPVHFFGYDSNVNIQTKAPCRECWWKTDMWWRECPEGYPMPAKCMSEIGPEVIIEAIGEIEKMSPLEDVVDESDINEQFARELVLDEAHYKSEQHQWDRVQTMMSQCKGKKVLEVGAGDGYCVEILQKRGFEVTATEVSKIRIQRMKEKGIEAIYADVNELPFEDKSFDTVICGEVLEHIDSMGRGLRELERVCKPDGRIIISLPIHPRYDDIKMHLWAIRHHTILCQGKEDLMVLSMERINRERS